MCLTGGYGILLALKMGHDADYDIDRQRLPNQRLIGSACFAFN